MEENKMSDNFRYVLLRTGSGTTELIDTLHDPHTFVGLKNIDAMGLTRSDLEELVEQLEKMLDKA